MTNPRRIAPAAAVMLIAGGADGATLIETRMGDAPVRIVADEESRIVLVEGAAGRRLIDVDRAVIYVTVPGQPTRRVALGDLPQPRGVPADHSILPLGPGPEVAGYPTARFRLVVSGMVCTDLYVNLGLAMALGGALSAFDLLDRFNALVAGPERPPCATVPFRAYAHLGWALRVEDAGAPPVETVAIDPDYAPGPDELAVPPDSVDITAQLRDRVEGRHRAP